MRLEEVVAVLSALDDAGVETWLEGGWGIDALVGQQTRDHRDVDLDIDASYEATALEVLDRLGYAVQTDWRPTRVELVANGRGWVDLHPLRFGPDGDARQAAPDGTFWNFPKRYFTTGHLDQRDVGCFTIEAQRYFHAGYELRAQDRLDLAVLDKLEASGEM
jgi:lincosamide nucleotidyltransferase A/C/D/E